MVVLRTGEWGMKSIDTTVRAAAGGGFGRQAEHRLPERMRFGLRLIRSNEAARVTTEEPA
jgi:hypothetical protein